jgi:acyl dehydratase
MAARLGLAPAFEEEAIRQAEGLQGEEIRIEPYNNQASRDVIRHYAYGIGDANPLWCDPGYAARSPFGRLVAPPTFLYSSFDGAIGAGLPGVQPVYAGTDWVFHRRVLQDEEIVPVGRFGRVRRLQGRTASEMLIQEADVEYRVGDESVATARASTFRLPRRDAESGGLAYEPREEYQYSAEETERIRHDALNEYRRGADPLEFGALTVGAEIPAVVKGPIDRITMTAYYAGCIGSPGYKACEVAWTYRDWALNAPANLPSNYDPSYFAETVLPSLGHQDTDVAREIGMPNAYDNGPQRCGWFGNCVTNWMGDLAFLRRLSVRLRRPDIFGDTVWISGRITGLEKRDGLGSIEIELTAVNQLDDVVATGTAEVLTDLADPRRPVHFDL